MRRNARFPTLQREKIYVFDVFCRFPTVECAEMHVFPLESGKTCISAHSTVGKRQNTSKTCIFTLWRVGKRAFLRILQWENGKIRQKRTFKTYVEWKMLH